MTVSVSEATPKTSTITGVDLVGYFVSDPPKAIAFYRDVMGMTPTEIDPDGRGAEFTLADGTTFGVWKSDDTPDSGGIVMFAVDEASAAISQFRERGAKLSDPMETPVCFMSFGSDPDGNAIIVHQRKVKD
jgi:predicted enzyme related to lactoylglutathione lyase